MPSPDPRWVLEGFLERLDTWIADESPADDLRLAVTAWILSRMEDPYEGVRREPDFENLWFGAVPGTETTAGTVVACSYWIAEARGTVRCDSFATLSLPI
jgi:hypothetical protein